MTKRIKSSNATAKPAIYGKFMLLTLLLTTTVSIATDRPLVPDNIAPHPAPAQPLPFSHKTHVSAGLACQFCHVNPEPGNQMTFPATETCMACHATIATDKAAIMSLLKYSASGQKIPWQRVYTVTPGVNWNHRAHLDTGTQCETCHGAVSEMESMAASKAVLAMASCISCHRASDAPTECVTCHSWPTDRLLGLGDKASKVKRTNE